MKFKLAILVLFSIFINLVSVKASEIVTVEEAEIIAESNLPQRSKLVDTTEKKNKYELKFYNKYKKEKYQIDIDKYTQQITTYKSQLDHLVGSEKIDLNEQKIEQIVLEQIPNAQDLLISLEQENNLYKYDVTLNISSYSGQISINPSTGIISEKTFKLIAEVDKDTKLLSFDEIQQIALSNIPYSIIVDINLENDEDSYIYEVKIYDDNSIYNLKINAITGEKVSLDINKNEWSTNNPNLEWIYTKLKPYPIYTNVDYITLKNAKQLAIAKVPGAELVQIDVDEVDGQPVYSGVMYKDNFEYQFSLDYYTGQIVKWIKEEIN